MDIQVLVSLLLLVSSVSGDRDDLKKVLTGNQKPDERRDQDPHHYKPGQVHTHHGGMNFANAEDANSRTQTHGGQEAEVQREEIERIINGEPAFAKTPSRKKRDTDVNAEGSANKRVKRLVLTDPSEYWPKGIVPFKFHEDMSDEEVDSVLAAQKHIMKYTCIEFVEHDGGNANTNLNLGHVAHLFYKPGWSCSSYVGLYNITNGQDIICCDSTVCIHENVHALGFLHEQSGDLADTWIRINYENIDKNYWGNFVKVHPDLVSSPKYDYSSLMHYGLFEFTKNWKPVFTELCGSPNFQFGGNPFYMYREVASIYKCGTTGVCANTNLNCENQGFVTHSRGQCKCECPPGLDPDLECAAPVTTTPRTKYPKGTYAFLKPEGGCPSGLAEGEVTLESSGGNSVSSPFHLFGDFTATSHTYHFCVKETESSDDVDWEHGNFCVFKKGSCPTDFFEGSVTLAGSSGGAHSHSGVLPDGSFGQNVRFDFCCMVFGISQEPVWFPNTHELTLMKSKSKCQEIDGMYVVPETFTFDNVGTSSTSGLIPELSIKTSTDAYTFGFCHYTPLDRDCGGIITLSESSPSQGITSPGYPNAYGTGRECTWLIKAPENSRLAFNFADFDIPLLNWECADYVEIRKDYIGQPGTQYCGDGFDATIRSWTNEAMIVFKSDGSSDAGAKGFDLTVTLVMDADLCYNEIDRGSTYRGTRNITHDYKPCIPWSEMTHCRHHPFKDGDFDDGLDGNYCRNPGHGVEPWCYTRKDGCERSCCDSCFYGNLYDNHEDCGRLIQDDPDFCSRTEVSYDHCAKTCKDHLNIPTVPPIVSTISCPNPPALSDSTLTNTKSTYKVGDHVEYHCNTGSEVVDSFCLTSGEWSPVGYTCGGCSTGWSLFRDSCYKYIDDRVMYAQATAACSSEGGIVATAKEPAEQEFIAQFERPMNPMWIGLYKENSAWLWSDGTKLTWGNWAPGQITSDPNTLMLTATDDYQWKTKDGAEAKNLFTFVCKVPRGQRQGCADREVNCEGKIRERPGMCTEFRDYADSHCAKTCGICDSPAACPYGWRFNGGKCFKYFSEELTYSAASTRCSENGGMIAKTNTEEDLAYVLSFQPPGQSIWIGADDLQTEGVWAFQDGSILTLTSKWAAGQPNNYGGAEDCAVIDGGSFFWLDKSCTSWPYTFVCSFDTAGAGWSSHNGFLYKFHSETLNHDGATAACASEDAILAPTNTISDLDFVKSLSGGNEIWLGADDKAVEDTWVFPDGTPLTLTSEWGSNQPNNWNNEDCAVISTSGQWFDKFCSYSYAFVCRKNAGTCNSPEAVTNGAVVTTGTVNIGDKLEFTCNYDYEPNGGSGLRSCLRSGDFNEPEIDCVDATTTTAAINNVDIIKRKSIAGTYRSWIGNDTVSTIRRRGKIIAWKYYSIKSGQVALQVFKIDNATTNTYKWVGQNVINPTKAYEYVYYKVPTSSQISVEGGYRIGVWYAFKSGGVCYSTCSDGTGYNGLKLKAIKYYASYFKTTASYEFVQDTTCREFSLSAVVGPP